MSVIKNLAMITIGGAIFAGAAHVLTDGESTEMLKSAFSSKILHKGAAVAETLGDVAEDISDVASDIADGVTI